MRRVMGALLLAGCQLASAPATLPTYDPGAFCSLAELLPTIVHIEPDADPPTWVDGPTDGTRTNLEWPTGFSLRVSGDVAEVIDPDGVAVARDGTQITDVGGGSSARGDVWFAVCSIRGRSYTTGDT